MRLAVVLLIVCVTAVAARRHRYKPEHFDQTFPTADELKGVLDEDTLARVQRSVKATASDADRIIDYVLNGNGKHQTYNRLAEFVDTFGPRLCGHDSHTQASQGLLQRLTADGLENVHGETAMVPIWTRNAESATMLEPRVHKLNMLGLGGSIGTPNTTAEVLVVQTFDELNQQAKAGNTSGKIIVFNEQCDWVAQPIRCYGSAVMYRVGGAQAAAKVGAVAALVRTVAAFSINSPHTGDMDYAAGVPQIPTAAITIEDAEMMQRMQDRGQRIVVELVMGAQNLPPAASQNVVAEWTGTDFPDQIVLVSGHLDSWDVGQGAMDDGGGAFISWAALSLLRQLNIRPRRTIRFVGWSCEELGGIGAQAYFNAHQSEVPNMDFVMESDLGVFKALGMEVQGNSKTVAILQQIVQLLAPINATTVAQQGGGTDIDPWEQAGVPGGSLLNANAKYFYFHHSDGDTMTVLNADDVDTAAITWAVTALAIANLDDMMPR